jgi:ribonuclease VapC
VIVDASAVLAILFEEPGFDSISRKLAQPGPRLMTAVNWMEAALVVQRKHLPGMEVALSDLLRRSRIEVVPVTADLAASALEAYRRFGKGNHPARLNFGDCFAYALARETSEALLFVGEDFAQTDIAAA